MSIGIFAWAAAGGASTMLLGDTDDHTADSHNEDEEEVGDTQGLACSNPS